ncbi:MAG: ornithine carbamoyltransferase [Candidatus Brocadiaceae bacterium]|nr:ornithine carbamoyltransferase [Candidatus Brocadiaceae bacterium]
MHLITLMDWEPDRICELLSLAHDLKARARAGTLEPTLRRKTLALLFEKPSIRTRVSFQVAMTQLGGSSIYVSQADANLGKREPIKDGARVLARYVDGVAARTFAHETVEQLAAYSSVPVINALSDAAHPCQALADVLTIQERFEEPEAARVVFVGDANNVSRSLATLCAKLRMDFTLACPPEYSFTDDFMATLHSTTGRRIVVCHDPAQAAAGADVLYTDVWTSMGQEAEAEARKKAFAGFCVDAALVARAAPGVIVMHDLPAHRGEEISDDVIEGPHSAVFDQAENRLHAERALLQMLLA